MAEPQTVNTGIIVPNTGDLVGTWGSAAINPDFVAIDGYLGGVQTISLSNVNVTLTSPAAFTPTPSAGPTQAQNAVLRFTGALSANIIIILPLPGFYIVENLTTAGGNIIQFRAAVAGEVICVDQGECQHIYNDGTNVRFVNLPAVGTYLDIAASAVPAWISNCTKPPYLNCDGSTFSAVTYPYLNFKLGGNTLPDLRGVARYTLNQGTGRLTSAGSGLNGNTIFSVKTTQTYSLITGNLPPYTPAGAVGPGTVSGGVFGGSDPAGASIGSGGTTPTVKNSVAIVVSGGAFTGTAQGGTSSPFGVVGPGTISGITLIRAA